MNFTFVVCDLFSCDDSIFKLPLFYSYIFISMFFVVCVGAMEGPLLCVSTLGNKVLSYSGLGFSKNP